MSNSVLIYNARLLDKKLSCKGALLIVNGKIAALFQGDFTSEESARKLSQALLKEGEAEKLEYFDAKALTLTPAFIDMHVHMRYPGLTQKEDLNTGLRAAASGGFGTVVAMANTKPVVSSLQAAEKIEEEARELGLSNLFQVVSITKDFDGQDTSHLNELDPTKTPVISEDGKDILSSEVMLEGMKIAAKKNLIVACHCEDPTFVAPAKALRAQWTEEAISKANELLALAEDSYTIRNIMLAKEAGCALHLCHVSTAKCMEEIRRAKKDLRLTCEVTPHHIGLSGEKAPEIFNIVNPPLRSEKDRKALIEAVREGLVDCISTDHAPHTEEDKKNGAPGFTGLELSYAVCNTVLVKENGISENRLSELMSANPAAILSLKKGLLQPGYDADLTLLDPDFEWKVDSSKFYSKGKFTPFNGKVLKGKVKSLFIGGKKVWDN